MPGYIPTIFYKFQQKPPAHAEDAPHTLNKTVYVKHIQLATQQSSAPKLNSADTNRVQSINGTFLYYALALDPTMIPSIKNISACQYVPTQYIMEPFNQVMDYVSTHPNSTIRYHPSNLILMTDIDADYLVIPVSCSHIAGHYYFTNHMLDYSKGTPPQNVHILT